MEYQKITNMSGNTPNQPFKLRTKNWVKINYVTRGTHNTNNQIKTITFKLSLCDNSDMYIVVSSPK